MENDAVAVCVKDVHGQIIRDVKPRPSQLTARIGWEKPKHSKKPSFKRMPKCFGFNMIIWLWFTPLFIPPSSHQPVDAPLTAIKRITI